MKVPRNRLTQVFMALSVAALLGVAGCGKQGAQLAQNPDTGAGIQIFEIPHPDGYTTLWPYHAEDTVYPDENKTVELEYSVFWKEVSIKLTFPVGAVTEPTLVTIDVYNPVRARFEFEPSGTDFNAPVTLDYEVTNLNPDWLAGLLDDISVFWYDETQGQWVDLVDLYGPDAVHVWMEEEEDEATLRVQATLQHFSVYAIGTRH